MSLVFVDQYGAPDYSLRKGTVGVIFHTTEGSGRDRVSAIATAKWQGSAGNTSGGSYNYLVGYDGDVVTAVRSVHVDHSSGGISTTRDPAIWQPGRYPELLAYMGATALADPNAYVVQVALQGQTAWFKANGYPPALVDAMALLVKQLEDRYRIPDIYMGAHYMFQTDRSDPGPLLPLIVASYQRQFGGGVITQPEPIPTEVDVPTPDLKFKVQRWTTLLDAPIRRQASLSAPIVATIPKGTLVATVAESVDGVWRVCIAGNPEELFYVIRRHMEAEFTPSDPELEAHVAAAFNKVKHYTQAELDAVKAPADYATLARDKAALEERLSKKNVAIDAARAI